MSVRSNQLLTQERILGNELALSLPNVGDGVTRVQPSGNDAPTRRDCGELARLLSTLASEHPWPMSGRITWQTYLRAGGTGDVGVGIVGVLLDRGASVIVPGRSAEKGARLRGAVRGDELLIIPGDVGSVDGAAALAAQIDGPLDGVVASLGGWWQGPALTAVSGKDWDAIIAGNLKDTIKAAD